MGKREYIIRFGGLGVGVHSFSFKIGDAFFKGFENSEISQAELDVTATLTKQNNLLTAQFLLKGIVGVDCDRCLKTFGFPVEAEESLVIKHGNPSESNDEILVIPAGAEEFDASQYLYEYVTLALPARRVPCEIDARAFKCDYEMLDKLDKLAARNEEREEGENPLWKELTKIKFKN
jgi:uncharacterized protein